MLKWQIELCSARISLDNALDAVQKYVKNRDPEEKHAVRGAVERAGEQMGILKLLVRRSSEAERHITFWAGYVCIFHILCG